MDVPPIQPCSRNPAMKQSTNAAPLSFDTPEMYPTVGIFDG
jgi:hypothetical protein